jgi:hypothetical protein
MRGWVVERRRFVTESDPNWVRSGVGSDRRVGAAAAIVFAGSGVDLRRAGDAPVVNCEQTCDMDRHMDLDRQLEQACARRDREPSFSPDWDAAMAHVEDLTRQLWLLEAARQATLAILARVPAARATVPAAH